MKCDPIYTGFQLSETDFRLLASRTLRGYIFIVLSHQVIIYYSSCRKWIQLQSCFFFFPFPQLTEIRELWEVAHRQFGRAEGTSQCSGRHHWIWQLDVEATTWGHLIPSVFLSFPVTTECLLWIKYFARARFLAYKYLFACKSNFLTWSWPWIYIMWMRFLDKKM